MSKSGPDALTSSSKLKTTFCYTHLQDFHRESKKTSDKWIGYVGIYQFRKRIGKSGSGSVSAKCKCIKFESAAFYINN